MVKHQAFRDRANHKLICVAVSAAKRLIPKLTITIYIYVTLPFPALIFWASLDVAPEALFCRMRFKSQVCRVDTLHTRIAYHTILAVRLQRPYSRFIPDTCG
jgi:hypothetical protein